MRILFSSGLVCFPKLDGREVGQLRGTNHRPSPRAFLKPVRWFGRPQRREHAPRLVQVSTRRDGAACRCHGRVPGSAGSSRASTRRWSDADGLRARGIRARSTHRRRRQPGLEETRYRPRAEGLARDVGAQSSEVPGDAAHDVVRARVPCPAGPTGSSSWRPPPRTRTAVATAPP